MNLTHAVLAATWLSTCLMLVSCDSGPERSAAAPSAPIQASSLKSVPNPEDGEEGGRFSTDWLPKAMGEGNFEICATDLAGNGFAKLRIPPRLPFYSWGRMTESLLRGGGNDQRAFSDDPAAVESRSFGVITTTAATLSPAHPCALVEGRAIIGDNRAGQAVVPASLHYVFQPDGAPVITPSFHLVAPGPTDGTLDRALLMGIVNGTPIQDVRAPVTIQEQLFQ